MVAGDGNMRGMSYFKLAKLDRGAGDCAGVRENMERAFRAKGTRSGFRNDEFLEMGYPRADVEAALATELSETLYEETHSEVAA